MSGLFSPLPLLRLLALTVLICSLNAATWAGGPLVVSKNGSPVLWPSGGDPIVLTLDQGPLGPLSNDDADDLVANVIEIWNGVPESSVDLSIAAQELSEDVDHTNLTDFWSIPPLHGFNPVIYDTDGQIIDLIGGAGAKTHTLGIAGPVFAVDNAGMPVDGPIVEGRIVLNGHYLTENPSDPIEDFEGVIIHETGHLLGLGHAQINADEDTSNEHHPTMFPLYFGGSEMRSLEQDDIGWISAYYPSAQYESAFGTITGEVLDYSRYPHKGFQGINVIARLVGGDLEDATSVVSGFLYHDGQGPENLRGHYRLPGLPPGDYTVEIEEILDEFDAGSSVGPLDPPVDFPGISGPEYYNGPGESEYDNPDLKTEIEVTPGAERGSVDIILNTEEPRNRASHWSLFR